MRIMILSHKIPSGISKWMVFWILQTPPSFTHYRFTIVLVVTVEAIALAQVALWAVLLVAFWHQQLEQGLGMVNMLHGLKGGYMKRGAKWERAGSIFQETARSIPLLTEKYNGIVLVVSFSISFDSPALEFLFDLYSLIVIELINWNM